MRLIFDRPYGEKLNFMIQLIGIPIQTDFSTTESHMTSGVLLMVVFCYAKYSVCIKLTSVWDRVTIHSLGVSIY